MDKITIIFRGGLDQNQNTHHYTQAKKELSNYKLDFKFAMSVKELKLIVNKLDNRNCDVVILMGGDGTIHQALPGLLKKNIALYPFAMGTANDLASELGLEAKWKSVKKVIEGKKTKSIDVIMAGKTPIATVAGVGIGADLTDQYNKLRISSPMFKKISKTMGSQIYTLLSIKNICLNKNIFKKLRVKSGEFDETFESAALFITNQKKLGGDLLVSESAINNDSRFEVLILPRKNWLTLMGALFQLKLGHWGSDFISFSTDQLFLESSDGSPLALFGDGENIKSESELLFKIRHDALRVCTI